MERLRRIVTVCVSTLVFGAALTARDRTALFEAQLPPPLVNTHAGSFVVIREKSPPAGPSADRYTWAPVVLVAMAAAAAGGARRRRGTAPAVTYRTFRLS